MRARFLPVLILLTFLPATAFAQSARTWVSGSGDDNNPCSYSAPCKTIGGALPKTLAGGVVSVKDAAGYGLFTITKPITIDGGGTYASMLHWNVDAVNINLTTNYPQFANTVVLRGLSFDSNSGYGVMVTGTQATNLHIENCTFTNSSVAMIPGAEGSSLTMREVDIRSPGGFGIVVSPPAGVPLTLTMRDVHVTESTGAGLQVYGNTNGTIVDSAFTDNVDGVVVGAATSHLNLTRTVLSGNSSTGMRHSVAGVATVLDGSSIFGNGTGISNIGGTVIGFFNNSIGNNVQDVTGNAVQSQLQP